MGRMIILVGLIAVWLATPATAQMAQRQEVCLNGVWDFAAIGTEADSIPDYELDFPVPSGWIGNAVDNFENATREIQAPQAWFGRDFHVPADWDDDRRILLYFDCLDDAHAVWINGEKAHESDSLGLCVEVDVTDKVRFGEINRLDVRTTPRPTSDILVLRDRFEQGRYQLPPHGAGIVRDVFLQSQPRVAVDHVQIITSVENETITVNAEIKNHGETTFEGTYRPVVKDDGVVVLTLPAVPVTIEPGQMVRVQTEAEWEDPVLWGFEPYGQPHLYYLQSDLFVDGGRGIDERWDRFGFREFKTEGDRFVFNGKNYVGTGDLLHRGFPFSENPSVLTAFYQAMRGANVNFQRMHSYRDGNFDSPHWFTVADELGHLFQEQHVALFHDRPNHPRLLAQWSAFVRKYINHPSIVMWSADNERFSAPGVDNGVIKVLEADLEPWNELATHIRTLDPTRVLEFHHGWALWAGVQAGRFDADNYMTFNIHPYGKLDREILASIKASDFDRSVPIVVGEIFDMQKAGDIVDFTTTDHATYDDVKRRGQLMAQGIRDSRRAGAANIVLCSLEKMGMIGPERPGEINLGPWTDEFLDARDRHEDPENYDMREHVITVDWPSQSGVGTKAQFIKPAEFFVTTSGFGPNNVNWFDSSQPIYRPSVAHHLIRQAFADVAGRSQPPLGPRRSSEVLVTVTRDGQPVEGAYVNLVPMAGQAPPAGVATDARGTAWLRVWDTGWYKVAASDLLGEIEDDLKIQERPMLTDQAGYGHLMRVSLETGLKNQDVDE